MIDLLEMLVNLEEEEETSWSPGHYEEDNVGIAKADCCCTYTCMTQNEHNYKGTPDRADYLPSICHCQMNSGGDNTRNWLSLMTCADVAGSVVCLYII